MAENFREWFEVIKDGKFLGVVPDVCFARYSEKSRRVHVCRAMNGEYLILNDKFYRDDWMLPVHPDSPIEYETATVSTISEKEYDILNKIETIDPINVEDLINSEPEDIPEKKPVMKNGASSEAAIEFVRKSKLEQLSAECKKIIEDGYDLVLSDGASHHFSLTVQDQLNLVDMQRALDDGGDFLYHADGELFQVYSDEDAADILIGAKKWKQYNQALFNSLKNWVNHLNDLEDIMKVQFDSEIPEEYCTPALITLAENF